ncbi:MAG: hypothetical protein R3F31_07640 [Verrucomicrobiales bacterium]
MAKGARRPKSPFAGRLDLFYRCEFLFVPARRGDLQTLTEVTVVDSRIGLRASYLQSLAAAYFVKLIEQVAEPGLPVPELEDLLERGLNYLASKAPTGGRSGISRGSLRKPWGSAVRSILRQRSSGKPLGNSPPCDGNCATAYGLPEGLRTSATVPVGISAERCCLPRSGRGGPAPLKKRLETVECSSVIP